MKLKGCLTRPTIKKYYGTGSLQQKRENPALKEMLKNIKDGGINAFLNDKELKQFAQGLISSFESEGYLNKDKTLTPSGEDIVETGKAWRGLQGAFSLTVLEYQGKAYLLDAVLVKENDVGELVMGFPRNMDGSEGPRAELCREFAAKLTEATGLKVTMWDERRTTVEAHNILSQHNYHGKKRKNTVDAVAASLILEGYLAFRKR